MKKMSDSNHMSPFPPHDVPHGSGGNVVMSLVLLVVVVVVCVVILYLVFREENK